MRTVHYSENELLNKFNLPCLSFDEFISTYEAVTATIGYNSRAHAIHGYIQPNFLPDAAYLVNYGAGSTVFIRSFFTGLPTFTVHFFASRELAVEFLADIEDTLFVPIPDVLTFITDNIGFWSFKAIVNIINDNDYSIIFTVDGLRVEVTDNNYKDVVIVVHKSLLMKDTAILDAKTAVEYYRKLFKMSRRFVADITGIPFKTISAFENVNSSDRTILKTSAAQLYKLAQLFGVTMEQLLLKECEINPAAAAILENKEV